MRFRSVSRTHVGLRRKINEDSAFADPERGLWAVADGMGGHDAGEVASAMVIDALRGLPTGGDLDEIARGAVEALHRVNRDLVDLARTGDDGRGRTIGTTVVGLAATGDAYRCFWTGDSRAYRLRDGAIQRVSRDHSLVQDLVDAGMMTEEEAETHEDANVITRAVGAAETVKVDVVDGDVRPGDCFLLASDGLTRVVPDDELSQVLSTAPLDEAADRLIDTVLARGAPDNVTLIIALAC